MNPGPLAQDIILHRQHEGSSSQGKWQQTAKPSTKRLRSGKTESLFPPGQYVMHCARAMISREAKWLSTLLLMNQ